MRITGKGRGISLKGRISQSERWTQMLAHASDGVPVHEWKPYVPSREMQAASARAAEIHKIPSLVK